MTISSTDSRKSYAGDGVTTLFSTSPVVFFDATDLIVRVITTATGVIDQTLTLNTHYTVSGGNGAVGSVNLAAGSSPFGAPASGKTLLIVREIPLTQASDFVNNDASDAEVVERALDRAVVRDQQIDEVQDRTIKLSVVETATAGLTELPFNRASKVLAFDASKNLIAQANVPTSGVAATPFMETVLDDSTAAAARATLGFTDATAKGDIPAAAGAGQYGRKAVGSNGDVLQPSSGATDGLAWVGAGLAMWNGTLAVSVAANALTVAVKTDAGVDPSASDPVFIAFRDPTLTTGTYTVLTLTAATSFVVSSGSTLGTVSAQTHRIYVIGVNDGGTFRLGVWNPWDDTNKSLLGIDENRVYSSTAEGGAGAADSAQVLYTGAAVTSKAVRILGYFESTQTTAGTWATEDSVVQAMGPSVRRTGDVVQTKRKAFGTVATGTTTIPHDNTIPQNTEGTEFIDISITPTSAINLLRVQSLLIAATSAGSFLQAAMFRDATADALVSSAMGVGTVSRELLLPLRHQVLAGSASLTTFDVRAGADSAATVTVNGVAGGQIHGGVMNSFIEVEEIFV